MTLTAKRMMCLVLRAMLMLMLIIVYRSSSAALLGLSREDQWVSASSLLGFRWLSLSSLFHFLESRCNTKLTKSITLCFCFRLLVLLSTKLALIIWSPHSFPLWKWLPKYGPATSIINDGGYLQLWSQIKAIMNAINVMIASYKLSILMHTDAMISQQVWSSNAAFA